MKTGTASGLQIVFFTFAVVVAGRRPEPLDAVAGEVEAMQGKHPGRFRIRQGDWRAVFRMDGGDVLVDRVGNRGEVYR